MQSSFILFPIKAFLVGVSFSNRFLKDSWRFLKDSWRFLKDSWSFLETLEDS